MAAITISQGDRGRVTKTSVFVKRRVFIFESKHVLRFSQRISLCVH